MDESFVNQLYYQFNCQSLNNNEDDDMVESLDEDKQIEYLNDDQGFPDEATPTLKLEIEEDEY